MRRAICNRRSRVLRFALPVLLLVGGCVPSILSPEDPTGQTKYGNYTVRTADYDLYDAARDRTLPIRMYIPESDTPRPVVIFSPSLGFSRAHYADLGEYWASIGYLSVHISHPGTDADSVYGDNWALAVLFQFLPVRSMLEALTDVSQLRARPADVSFVIDQLSTDDRFTAVADVNHLAVAGHSLGAFTALVVGGMEAFLPGGPPLDVPDPRVDCIIAMSPPVTNVLGVTRASWDTMSTPCLSMIGTLDYDIVTTDPRDRRAAYDFSHASDQYLVTIADVTHGVFNDSSPYRDDRISYSINHVTIEHATGAFLDAYLRNSVVARTWLISGGVELLSLGRCNLEYKNVQLFDLTPDD